jgi:hypothetical protein
VMNPSIAHGAALADEIPGARLLTLKNTDQ